MFLPSILILVYTVSRSLYLTCTLTFLFSKPHPVFLTLQTKPTSPEAISLFSYRLLYNTYVNFKLTWIRFPQPNLNPPSPKKRKSIPYPEYFYYRYFPSTITVLTTYCIHVLCVLLYIYIYTSKLFKIIRKFTKLRLNKLTI